MKKQIGTYVPQWKLRRIGPRAVRILARHKDQSTVLGQYENSLVPAVTKFVELYDGLRVASSPPIEREPVQSAVATLRTVGQRWLSVVVRDIPGLDIASFTERNQVTDDAISNAERLLEACRTFKGPGDAPLPYKDAMEKALGAAIAAASKEWEKQLAHKANVQAMLIETRSAAVILQRELVAFRGSLRAEIGRNHVDYRALRSHPKTPEDDSIEEVIEPDTASPTAANANAAPVATPPTPTKENAVMHADLTTAHTNGVSTTASAA